MSADRIYALCTCSFYAFLFAQRKNGKQGGLERPDLVIRYLLSLYRRN